MRFKPGLVIASIAGATALAGGVGSALAAGGATCSYPSLANSLPIPPPQTMTGAVKCSKPAGKGTAKFTYTSTLAPGKGGKSLNLVDSGTFKDTFKKGTLLGSFKTTGVLVPPKGMTFTMSGKFKITGVTGKLKGAHGSGRMVCTSKDLTAHFTCKQVLKKGKL